MVFLIATNNQDKKAEIERILSPLGIEFKTAKDLGKELPEVEETESTFAGNAYLKAKSACDFFNMPAIADDSGLVVDALNGEPGVYSARYSGVHGDNKANNKKVLEKLCGVPYEKRTARFVCSVCAVFPDGDIKRAEGKVEGIIGFEEKGTNGFGYDPLFMVGDRSFGEFSSEEKDKISHRSRALCNLKEELKNIDK